MYFETLGIQISKIFEKKQIKKKTRLEISDNKIVINNKTEDEKFSLYVWADLFARVVELDFYDDQNNQFIESRPIKLRRNRVQKLVTFNTTDSILAW